MAPTREAPPSPEGEGARLYAEACKASDEARELLNEIGKVTSETRTGTRDKARLERLVEQYGEAHRREIEAIDRWLAHVGAEVESE